VAGDGELTGEEAAVEEVLMLEAICNTPCYENPIQSHEQLIRC
jgi:hypothetical protein